MRTKQQSGHRRIFLTSRLITLGVIILLSCSQKSFGQWGTTPGTNNISYNTGNVGIGTSSPAEKLDVLSSGTARVLIGDGCSGSGIYGGIGLGISSFGGCSNYSVLGNGVSSFFNSPSSHLYFRVGNADKMIITSGGYVGIGTTSPLYLLDVNAGPNGFRSKINTVSANDAIATFENANGIQALLRGNGNFGLGTTNPAYRFDVQGGQINSAGGLCIAGDCKTAWSQVGGAVNSVFGRTGVVIAATNDYTWAQINKSSSSLADLATRNAGDLSSGTLPDARFPATLPAVSGVNLTNLNASSLASGTVPTARLGSGAADSTKFLRGDNTWAVPSGSGGSQWTTSGSNISYSSGNVGIGITTPGAKLEVAGNVNVTGTGNITAAGTIEGGNVKAKYQDVAEWVESSQELVAGTVVVLDSSRSNQVIATTQSYDSRVAGVISLRPGLTLGEEAKGRVLVATTGRVRVKVDATDGPIQIGDLLVTSNREGFAMKSLPVEIGGVRLHRPGTLIGKALEPLAKGTGEILVLLSLQ